MSSTTNIAVIVDAYSAANRYTDAFKEKGFACVHVQSTPDIPNVYKKSFRKETFIDNVIFDGDTKKATESLKKYQIRCVVAGIETGVEVADILSEALNMRTNGTHLSESRRNKFKMGMALQAAHLPTPKFRKVSTWEELIAWKESESVTFPIVLKPLNSGGTDGVNICKTEEELQNAFSSILGKTNVLGFVNAEILAQTFLDGQEYIVNSVSLDGKIYVVAILKGKKKFIEGHGYIYDREIMMKRHGKKQDRLVAMHEKVLAALNIKHGPAHGEYMFTKDGPVLIEVAARISGGVSPEGNNESVGCNQLYLNVDAYVDPANFAKTAENDYVRKKHFYDVEVSAPHAGTVGDTNTFVETIQKLPSFSAIRMRVMAGAHITKTVDLISSMCKVILVHQDKEVIEADYNTVTKLAKDLIQ